MRPEHYMKLSDDMFMAAMGEVDGSNSKVVLARYLRQCCKGLGELKKDLKEPDGDLYWSMNHLDQLTPELRKEHQDRLSGASSMLETFVQAESNLFKQHQVPGHVEKFILSQAKELTTDFSNYNGLSTSSRLRITQNIDELVDEVCNSSKGLERSEKTSRYLKRTAYLSAGAGVVVLNASADAITSFGLSPWMTVLSGELGSLIMSHAELSAEPIVYA